MNESFTSFLFSLFVCIQIVLTKSDLASKAELQKSLQSVFVAIASKRGQSCMPYVHAVSTVANIGMDAFKLDITQVHSIWDNNVVVEQNDGSN